MAILDAPGDERGGTVSPTLAEDQLQPGVARKTHDLGDAVAEGPRDRCRRRRDREEVRGVAVPLLHFLLVDAFKGRTGQERAECNGWDRGVAHDGLETGLL